MTHAQKKKVHMTSLDVLGLIATCFTTSSFVPQVWRTWRTRDVSGISLVTYVVITIGLGLWLVYGVLRGDLPLVIANSVMVVLTAAITAMKIAFTKRD
jgi:MtN3 and saliva related transmembrane protein